MDSVSGFCVHGNMAAMLAIPLSQERFTKAHRYRNGRYYGRKQILRDGLGQRTGN
nr:hypothetical protein Q903MT_gene1610 [Picea sitchensis]